MFNTKIITLLLLTLSPICCMLAQQQRQRTIDSIIQVCNENSVEKPWVLLSIADVETGGKFIPTIKCRCCKNKTGHWGLYQISNSYTELKDDDRLDIEKSTIAVWKRLEKSRQIIEKKQGRWDDNWYYSRIHNHGIFANKDHPLHAKFRQKLNKWFWYCKVKEYEN